jgi:signal transduction histidine kinase
MTTGQQSAKAYTRPTMEMGTLGERRQAEFDALYAEAKDALGQGANQLRDVTERLRESYAGALLAFETAGGADAEDTAEHRELAAELGNGRALLSRLDLATRDLEATWLFLERGRAGDRTASGRPSADEPAPELPRGGPAAMQILEAQESERTLLAEELHDGPAQTLANAAFQVEIIDRAMRSDPAAAQEELDGLRAMLARELERLRGFIHQLRPSLREEGDLGAAFDDVAGRLTEETGIAVDLQLSAPEEMLDLPRRTAVLRVAQEALRNVRKHAGATRVRVSTFLDKTEPPAWVLEVSDDGQGFSVDEALERSTNRHFGLRFMRERAQLIGARLEIVSDPAAGTTVRLAVDPRERS